MSPIRYPCSVDIRPMILVLNFWSDEFLSVPESEHFEIPTRIDNVFTSIITETTSAVEMDDLVNFVNPVEFPCHMILYKEE